MWHLITKWNILLFPSQLCQVTVTDMERRKHDSTTYEEPSAAPSSMALCEELRDVLLNLLKLPAWLSAARCALPKLSQRILKYFDHNVNNDFHFRLLVPWLSIIICIMSSLSTRDLILKEGIIILYSHPTPNKSSFDHQKRSRIKWVSQSHDSSLMFRNVTQWFFSDVQKCHTVLKMRSVCTLLYPLLVLFSGVDSGLASGRRCMSASGRRGVLLGGAWKGMKVRVQWDDTLSIQQVSNFMASIFFQCPIFLIGGP